MALVDNVYAQELMIALNHGNFEKTQFLIEKHPQLKDSIFLFYQDKNLQTYNGTTALHHCILHSRLEVIDYLLELGVSANLENQAQFKAFDFARYMAFTVFDGTDPRTHAIYTLLESYSQKETLEKALSKNETSKKQFKI